MTRVSLMSLAVLCGLICGCEGRQGTATPPGIATPSDLDPTAPRPATPAPTQTAPEGQSEPDPAPANSEPAAAPSAETGSGSLIGRKTREVADVQAATADPNWVVIQPEVSGSDPLSVAGTAYGRASTMAGSLGIVQWINQEKALNGMPPSYAQLQEFLRQNPRLEFPAVKDYQQYGYDARTGEFVVLENKAEKSARYRELGIPEE